MNASHPRPTTSLAFGMTAKTTKSKRRGADDQPAVARKPKILIVDHDPGVRRLMVSRLGAADYAVETADGAQAALNSCVRSRPNLVITDLRLNDMDGIALLKELKSRWPQLAVIILTAHGTISEAVQTTQCGAFGYLVKPVGREELLGQVQRAIAASSFALGASDWRANIVPRSQLLKDRLEIVNQAAGSDAAALLTGENGTGKELLARAIHAASARREKPFIAVRCGNTREQLLKSELFGADADEPGDPRDFGRGALQLAGGGTLLLDEIADLPVTQQAALSKALRSDSLHPGDKQARADVRLICTTSRDLKPLTDSGEFLEELYSQINVLPIEIPPLGRRSEDMPLLVSHFLEQAIEPGGDSKMYSPDAIERLATTDWPENVRQLFDLVKLNVAMEQGKVLTLEDAQPLSGAEAATLPSYDEARDRFSRDYLTANLQRTSGNVSQSARLAKRNRTEFYKLLARHRLRPDDFKNFDHASH